MVRMPLVRLFEHTRASSTRRSGANTRLFAHDYTQKDGNGKTMNTEECSAGHEESTAESLSHPSTDEETKKLEKRLAELREEGIIISADGPRKAWHPVARVPGGLERFLAERE